MILLTAERLDYITFEGRFQPKLFHDFMSTKTPNASQLFSSYIPEENQLLLPPQNLDQQLQQVGFTSWRTEAWRSRLPPGFVIVSFSTFPWLRNFGGCCEKSIVYKYMLSEISK